MRSTRHPLLVLALVLPICAHAEGWKPSKITDGMTGVSRPLAILQSSNTISLAFPYSGPTGARLMVRQDASGKKLPELMVAIDRGQIDCGGRGCTVRIQFGGSPPARVFATPPSDGSAQVIFLESIAPEGDIMKWSAAKAQQALVDRVLQGHRFKIGLPMFREGEHVFVFSAPENLKWPPQ